MSQADKPERFDWIGKRDQLAEEAKTMTCAEMAEKHGTYRANMRTALHRLGIAPFTVLVDWSTRTEELKRLAKTHTIKQLADHFGADAGNMYTVLRRQGIEAQYSERPVQFSGGLAELKRLAETKTERELAEHFAIARLTVRKHLKRMGVQCLQKPEPGSWAGRREELTAKLAAGWSVDRLAIHFGVSESGLRNAMSRIGVTIPRKPRPEPEAAPPKPEPKAQAVKQTKPAPEPRRPVEIIMPANVKVTRSAFTPPAGSRVCNGTTTTPYNPALHGGAMGSYR